MKIAVATLLLLVACESSSESASSGAPTCQPTLPSSPAGCPDTPAAEARYDAMKSKCAIVDADLDIADPTNPTLMASSASKACSTCDCRQAIYDYRAVYLNCTEAGQRANAALAKNVQELAASCE